MGKHNKLDMGDIGQLKVALISLNAHTPDNLEVLAGKQVGTRDSLDRDTRFGSGVTLLKNLNGHYDFKATFELGPKGVPYGNVGAADIDFCEISRACPTTLYLLGGALAEDYEVRRAYASQMEKRHLSTDEERKTKTIDLKAARAARAGGAE